MLEKRKYLRVPYSTPVTGKIQFVSDLRDLSINGCFVQTHANLGEGTIIEMEFTLPNTTRIIRARGEVRWAGQYTSDRRTEESRGMGIKFLEISVEDIAVISEFVKSRSETRRKFVRKSVEFPVKYGHEPENFHLSANALDLSLGGFFLKTENFLELNSIIYVEFLLPNTNHTIKCGGRVAWLNKDIPTIFQEMINPGMGIEFREISDSDLELIDKIISEMDQ